MHLLNKFSTLIPKIKPIYNFFKLYVDNYNGENNDNIFTNGEYYLMQHLLKSCKIVFDVGAHIGHWTKLAININQNLNIHCFEPSNFTFKTLLRNNFPENIICNNFGLSSVNERKPLYIFDNNSGINSLYIRKGLENGWGLKTQEKSEEVQLTTLEEYCQENDIKKIDYLKIDVEGHELEVLKGGKCLIDNSQIKIIQFEYGGCFIDANIFLKDIFNFFKNKPYQFYKIYPKRIRFISRYDTRFENFQYQNWLIINKKL